MIDPCCSPCNTTLPPVNIPGSTGPAGANGTNGSNGSNAFTTVTGTGFTAPADLTTPVIVSVASSLWMVVGQTVIVGQGPGATLTHPGPVTILVTAVASPNTFTGHLVNAADENVIVSSGASVTPTGSNASIPVPITIAGGGTNAITKAAAQTSLGLGQDSIVSSGAALAQTITASFVQVGAIDVTLPALGSYQVQGQVSIDFAGTTFASSRTITAKIRNITQGTDLSSATLTTEIQTTASFPTHQLRMPFSLYAGAAVNDHLQILIQIDVINTAGTLTVSAGSLEAVPLRKS